MESLDDWYPGEYALDAEIVSGPDFGYAGIGAYYYLEGYRHKTPWGDFSHRTWVDGSYAFSEDGLTPFRILYSGGNSELDIGYWFDLYSGEGSFFKIHEVSGPITSFHLIAVPEPATWTVCAIAGALVLLRRVIKRPN